MKTSRLQLFCLLVTSLLLSACATVGPKNITESIQNNKNKSTLIKNEVDFTYYKQGDRQCGPASLAMVLHPYRPDVSFETLQSMTYSPNAEGSFKQDMISAARRLGLATYQVTSVEQMFNLSAEGRPVLVFQNLGLSWAPQWHYAVLVGYDEPANKVLVHSGEHAYQRMRFKRFKHSWMRGGEWSYIVMPPSEVPDFASFEQALENAVVFEHLKKRPEALALYELMSKRWPDRFEADVGLANMYAPENNKLAIEALKRALTKQSSNPGIYYNLAYLYKVENQNQLSLYMQNRALEVAPPEQREFYQEKLKTLRSNL